MAEQPLLTLQISDHARIPYTSLGPDDRQRLDAWFGHLRNWRNDSFIRQKARQLTVDGEPTYLLSTSTDIVIAFTIAGDTITVVSLLGKDALKKFEAVPGRRAS